MQNVDGDIDIFSTAAADSDPDDEYQAPDINSANSQAQSKKVRREANKDDQLPAEVRQGMMKQKPTPLDEFSQKTFPTEKITIVQDKILPSRAASAGHNGALAKAVFSKNK